MNTQSTESSLEMKSTAEGRTGIADFVRDKDREPRQTVLLMYVTVDGSSYLDYSTS